MGEGGKEDGKPRPFVVIEYNPPPSSPVGYMQARIYNLLTFHLLYLLPVYLVDGGEESKKSIIRRRTVSFVFFQIYFYVNGGGEVLCPFHSDFKVLGKAEPVVIKECHPKEGA